MPPCLLSDDKDHCLSSSCHLLVTDGRTEGGQLLLAQYSAPWISHGHFSLPSPSPPLKKKIIGYPIAWSWWQVMQCFSSVHSITNILPLSLVCCMHHHAILSIISSIHSNSLQGWWAMGHLVWVLLSEDYIAKYHDISGEGKCLLCCPWIYSENSTSQAFLRKISVSYIYWI